MSTSTKTYVMFASKIPYSALTEIEEREDNDDYFHDLQEADQLGFDLIADHTGGEFAMVGKTIFESGEYGELPDFVFSDEMYKARDCKWMSPALKMFPNYSLNFQYRLFSITV